LRTLGASRSPEQSGSGEVTPPATTVVHATSTVDIHGVQALSPVAPDTDSSFDELHQNASSAVKAASLGISAALKEDMESPPASPEGGFVSAQVALRRRRAEQENQQSVDLSSPGLASMNSINSNEGASGLKVMQNKASRRHIQESSDDSSEGDGHHMMSHPSARRRPKAAPPSIEPPASETPEDQSEGDVLSPGADISHDPIFQAMLANLPAMDPLGSPGTDDDDPYGEEEFEESSQKSLQSVVSEEIDERSRDEQDSFVMGTHSSSLSSAAVGDEYEKEYVSDRSVTSHLHESLDWVGVDRRGSVGALDPGVEKRDSDLLRGRSNRAGGGA